MRDRSGCASDCARFHLNPVFNRRFNGTMARRGARSRTSGLISFHNHARTTKASRPSIFQSAMSNSGCTSPRLQRLGIANTCPLVGKRVRYATDPERGHGSKKHYGAVHGCPSPPLKSTCWEEAPEQCLRTRLRASKWGWSDGQKRAAGTPLTTLGPTLVGSSICFEGEKAYDA